LPGPAGEVTFSRVTNPIGRLASGLIALCFAWSALTWGSMPGCAGASGLDAVHGEHTGSSHHHGLGSGHRPASPQCSIHLCCAQAATPAGYQPDLVRIAIPELAGASVPLSKFFPDRPAHILPFAHAPPISA